MKSSLDKHLMTHTGEKPYQYTLYNKTFPRKSKLDRHMMTPTGEKPYQSTQCDRAFSRTSNLDTHMRTHTGRNHIKAPCVKKNHGKDKVIAFYCG